MIDFSFHCISDIMAQFAYSYLASIVDAAISSYTSVFPYLIFMSVILTEFVLLQGVACYRYKARCHQKTSKRPQRLHYAFSLYVVSE